jgi:hypothetical protein
MENSTLGAGKVNKMDPDKKLVMVLKLFHKNIFIKDSS